MSDGILTGQAPEPPRPDRRPVCGNPRCRRGIKPCAPCCRHGGWVHRHDGKHECAEPAGATAFAELRW